MSSSNPVPGRLVVRSPGATLDVLDPWLDPLTTSGAIGELNIEVAPGPYQVRARIADTENTQLVVVRPGIPTEIDVKLEFGTAAPVLGTTTRNETHGDLALILTGTPAEGQGPETSSRSCSLVLILRGLKDRAMAPLPGTGAPFELFDQRGRPVQLPPPTHAPERSGRISRALGWALPLPPGGYRLRWAGPSELPVEHGVWLSPGWQTLLFVPQGARGPNLPEMSIHLLRTGSSWDQFSPGWLDTEATLAALREDTASTVDPRSADFLTNTENPMLAILTLRMLGRARRAGALGDNVDEQGWARRAAGGIRQLRRSLGRHPDVVALAEQWPTSPRGRRLPQIPATPWPPLLADSLDLLLAADTRTPGVIPAGSLIEAVSGQRYASNPWLLWDPEGLPLKLTPQRRPRSQARPRSSAPGAGSVGGGTPTGRHSGMSEGSDQGPSGPESAHLAIPTPIAVERVEDLLSGVAQVLQLAPAEAAQRLGTAGIARRLGMATGLVEVCLDPALSNLRRADWERTKTPVATPVPLSEDPSTPHMEVIQIVLTHGILGLTVVVFGFEAGTFVEVAGRAMQASGAIATFRDAQHLPPAGPGGGSFLRVTAVPSTDAEFNIEEAITVVGSTDVSRTVLHGDLDEQPTPGYEAFWRTVQ